MIGSLGKKKIAMHRSAAVAYPVRYDIRERIQIFPPKPRTVRGISL
jgi:hypothetical protein